MKQQVTFQLLSIDWIAGDRLKWSGGQKSRRIVAEMDKMNTEGQC